MKTSLKQLCEAARQRNSWKLVDERIRNSRGECPIVAGYIQLTGNETTVFGNMFYNGAASRLAKELGLTVDAEDVMSVADCRGVTSKEKALRTRIIRYLGMEEVS